MSFTNFVTDPIQCEKNKVTTNGFVNCQSTYQVDLECHLPILGYSYNTLREYSLNKALLTNRSRELSLVSRQMH